MPEEKLEVKEEKIEVVAATSNPYSDENWAAEPTVQAAKKEEEKIEAKPEIKAEEEETLDQKDWLKREFEVDDIEVLKTERAEYKKWKETKQEEIKFANEQSEKLFNALKEGKEDDVYEMLDTKRKVSAIEKLNSSDILKLHIEQTNKHFKREDINDVFEEKYSSPPKPVIGDAEDEDDFRARFVAWEETKGKVDRRIERDAVTAKADLAKLNAELTLPDIQGAADPKLTKEAQQKELERLEAIKAQYLKVLESDYSKFSGYEVKAKDGEVEVPIAYVVTDEQRSALKDELKGFDVDGFIISRWFNKDGSPNITQTMDDIFLLKNKGEVFQKIANEAATKRLVQYLDTKAQTDIGGKTDKTFSANGQKNEQQSMAEFFWSQG
jgi:hypothetical protein